MPLLKQTNDSFIELNHTVDPDIVEGEWYRLRTSVSWREEAELASLRGIKMKMPFGKVGKINQVDEVEVELDSRELNAAKLRFFLIGWSHPVSLNGNTIDHLDYTTARAILRHINKILADVRGVKEGDPLQPGSEV